MIAASVKEAFDEACGSADVVLDGVEDFGGGKRREFAFTAHGRIFVIGIRMDGESAEELAARAGKSARFRADAAREK